MPEAASSGQRYGITGGRISHATPASPSPVASMLTAAAASPHRTAPPVMTAAPFKEQAPIWWRSPIVIMVGLGTAVILLGILLWPTSSSQRYSRCFGDRLPHRPSPFPRRRRQRRSPTAIRARTPAAREAAAKTALPAVAAPRESSW